MAARSEIIETRPMMLGINLDRPFPLGFGSLQQLPRVLFEVKAILDGKVVSGIGEASIDFPFSSYDAWDIFQALEQVDLLGRDLGNSDTREAILNDPNIKQNLLDQFPAAFTAVNMAIDDLHGKTHGQSVTKIYGGAERESGKALASISYQNEIALLIAEFDGQLERGFVPKPKVGQGLEQDFATIKVVAKVAEDRETFFVLDFNAQYSPEEFAKLVRSLGHAKVDLSRLLVVEQPTDVESGIKGLIYAKDALRVSGYMNNVMADESFVTLNDAEDCAKAGISLNFKIHKVGGLYQAKKVEAMLAEGQYIYMENLVGGTFPTAIGRVYDQQSAAVLKTTSLPGDGWEPSTDWFTREKHLIKQDFNFDSQTRRFTPVEGPGLGIDPDWEKINRFVVPNPRNEYRKIRNGQSGDRISITLKPGQNYGDVYKTKSGRNPDWNL
jgi:L-alanine-DL-glutamate epimerase-like enolase superfamily enzyme